ncbi:hypothetical protein [Tomitella biformata]|uniref:hypothetical protein n=1 Tax=Tomitella biformata TaxID=630403 RepID=UPI00056F0579|nr:hypothetical protein [Tomitella biformata]
MPSSILDLPSPDRCPGALRPHAAADGALVRLRLPGGQISATALTALGTLSGEFGDGDVHLTSRGNLQIRGLSDPLPEAFIAGLVETGLLPSPTHERARNIVASPLSGIAGGRADIRSLVPELDRLLCADPGLEGLSGRFLFGVDDGRGDLSGLRPDVWARFEDGGSARLGVGAFAGPLVAAGDVPVGMLDLARAFLATAGGVWNTRKLPDGGRGLLSSPEPDAPPQSEPMRYGLLDGAASVLAPLGVLGPQQISALGGGSDVVVTPWRGLVLAGVTDLAPLAAVGLAVTADSAWARVTACVGAPGCAKSAGDTRVVARKLAAAGAPHPVHVIGCERSCGAPTFDHDRVLVRSMQ